MSLLSYTLTSQARQTHGRQGGDSFSGQQPLHDSMRDEEREEAPQRFVKDRIGPPAVEQHQDMLRCLLLQ